MIFDITCIDTGATQRLKPRNKVTCDGKLWCENKEIASLNTLALVYSSSLVGGRFTLEWHRLKANEQAFFPLRIKVTVNNRGDISTWNIVDLSLLSGGVPLVIQNLDELLGSEIPFFASGLITNDNAEQILKPEQVLKTDLLSPDPVLT